MPRTHNKLGDRSFLEAGPQLWNDFHPNYGGLDSASILSYDFWKKHTFLATEAASDSFDL